MIVFIIDFEPIDVSGLATMSSPSNITLLNMRIATPSATFWKPARYWLRYSKLCRTQPQHQRLGDGISSTFPRRFRGLRLMVNKMVRRLCGFDDVSVFSSTEDVIPPLVLNAEWTGANSVRVLYSEPMDTTSVENPLNYTINATIDTISLFRNRGWRLHCIYRRFPPPGRAILYP